MRDFITLAVVIGLVLVARSTFADHYKVPSGSMIPSVEIGDRVIVNKAAYGLRLPLSRTWLTDVGMPERGDVVVLRSPENGIVLLKRVVAIGGDQVQVRHGRLTLNGDAAPIEGRREWLGDKSHPIRVGHGGPDYGPTVIPEGQLLVMGDNRGDSHDGRSFGLVTVDSVLGRAEAVYFRDGSLRWIDLDP